MKQARRGFKISAGVRSFFAEWIGTAGLLMVVIGSGIMGERLSGGNLAVALLANTLATVWGLYVLICLLAPISGGHFNPVVTLLMAIRSKMPWAQLLPFWLAQGLGAVSGAWLAHAMFDLDLIQWSTKVRTGPGQWLAELIATASLILVILRAKRDQAPALIASTIGAAYWFTASTSFANPAAVLGRMMTDTFAGIAPASAAAFVVSQVVGAGLGWGLHQALGSGDVDQ